MSRLRKLLYGDIRFQFKYGFYLVYLILTVFYVCLLYAFPENIRGKTASLLIYTDPAAMGLFFMGAIVLFEKSQRVLNSLAVSPVTVKEYILSKLISLGLIGTLVGTVIAAATGTKNIFSVVLGTFLGSILFSLFGLMAASVVTTLNQFMVATIPIELLCTLPPIIYLFGYRKRFLLLHPGCLVISLIEGEGWNEPFLLLSLCLWIILIFYISYRIVRKMFNSVGGVKL
jgi:fluoroquinolone transport system permease protein